MEQDAPLCVDGRHAQAVTGHIYTYEARYLVLGTLVNWTANVDASQNQPSRVSGSIRLSRGQTRGMAPTLVALMVGQAIDALPALVRPATH